MPLTPAPLSIDMWMSPVSILITLTTKANSLCTLTTDLGPRWRPAPQAALLHHMPSLPPLGSPTWSSATFSGWKGQGATAWKHDEGLKRTSLEEHMGGA